MVIVFLLMISNKVIYRTTTPSGVANSVRLVGEVRCWRQRLRHPRQEKAIKYNG